MADITVTAAQVAPVNETQYTPVTYIAGVAITKGQAIAINTTTGLAVLADGSSGQPNGPRGIALLNAAAGEPVVAIEDGSVYGFDLSALAYDAVVYVSNTAGALSGDAADSDVDTVVGRVKPMHDGATPTKVLDVNCRAVK